MTPSQVLVLLWGGSEVAIALTHPAPFRAWGRDRFSGVAVVFFVVFSIYAGVQIMRLVSGAAIVEGRAFVYGLGIVLAVAGIALRWYAVLTLGRFFTTRVMTRPDQTVVQRGPYRFVRHPSYTGALLTLLGVLLMSANWFAILCFPIALPGFAYRIRVEEQALLAGLGEPYREYMRRTRRLIPFVI